MVVRSVGAVVARSALAAGLLVGPLALAACGDDEGGAGGATTTTVDPLAEAAIDACGNDLSAVRSVVWGIDPASGAVRWTTSVPLAETYLLRDRSGSPRLSLVRRAVEAVVDPVTGDVVGYPTAGVHEVLSGIPVAGSAAEGSSPLLVDGEPQPSTIEVGGVAVATSPGPTETATVAVTATDALSGTPVWRVDLGPPAAIAATSAPVLFGDTVVVVASPPRPTCP